jgi:hypothetical protein
MQRKDTTRLGRIAVGGCWSDARAVGRIHHARPASWSGRTFFSSAETQEEADIAAAVGAMFDEGAPAGTSS